MVIDQLYIFGIYYWWFLPLRVIWSGMHINHIESVCQNVTMELLKNEAEIVIYFNPSLFWQVQNMLDNF